MDSRNTKPRRDFVKVNPKIGRQEFGSATVLNAQMKLYYYSGVGSTWGDRWVQAHQLYVSWSETQANRDNRRTGVPWKVQYGKIGGGSDSTTTDANGTRESTMLFQTGQTNTWKTWDLSRLTQQWVTTPSNNFGVMLWATNEDTDYNTLWFRSSEYSNSTYWPKLEVTYSTDAATKTVYFLKDHLGSIRATVLDSIGAPVIGYDDYDPWGYPLATRTKAIPNAYLQGASKIKFTGKERDDEYALNLDYFGARYYDFLTGRWISVDPFAGKYLEWSPYTFTMDNPIRLIDLDGKDVFLLTWAPAGENIGHSAIAIQQRDKDGNLTGKVIVRHLWPEAPVGISGQEDADYRTETIKEPELAKFEGGEGKGADGIIRISGDQAQDNKVSTSLDKTETNKTYDAVKNNCSCYTKTGVESTGISGGKGATATVKVLGVTVKEVKNVTTPVSVHNAVANSGDKRVTVVKPLPEKKRDPNIKIE